METTSKTAHGFSNKHAAIFVLSESHFERAFEVTKRFMCL